MRNLPVVPIVACTLLASSALAGPFKETLTTKEREAIVKALQTALPARNEAAEAKCQPLLDAYNAGPLRDFEKSFDAAACFRRAGNLGVALVLWRLYDEDGTDRAKKRDVLRSLATDFELAGGFTQAATYGERYASEFADANDAPKLLIRALCIRRQLGQTAEATRDAKLLISAHHIADAPERLCESVRPIAMPSKTP
jgi:hypothetical protein